MEPSTARPRESGRRTRRQGAAGTGKERRRCGLRWGARLTSCSLPADVATSNVCLGKHSFFSDVIWISQQALHCSFTQSLCHTADILLYMLYYLFISLLHMPDFLRQDWRMLEHMYWPDSKKHPNSESFLTLDFIEHLYNNKLTPRLAFMLVTPQCRVNCSLCGVVNGTKRSGTCARCQPARAASQTSRHSGPAPRWSPARLCHPSAAPAAARLPDCSV